MSRSGSYYVVESVVEWRFCGLQGCENDRFILNVIPLSTNEVHILTDGHTPAIAICENAKRCSSAIHHVDIETKIVCSFELESNLILQRYFTCIVASKIMYIIYMFMQSC